MPRKKTKRNIEIKLPIRIFNNIERYAELIGTSRNFAIVFFLNRQIKNYIHYDTPERLKYQKILKKYQLYNKRNAENISPINEKAPQPITITVTPNLYENLKELKKIMNFKSLEELTILMLTYQSKELFPKGTSTIKKCCEDAQNPKMHISISHELNELLGSMAKQTAIPKNHLIINLLTEHLLGLYSDYMDIKK